MAEGFDWKQIGNISEARPNLGDKIDVTYYRLTTLSVKKVLERELGKEKANELCKQGGRDAGKEVYKQFFAGVNNMNDLIKNIAKLFNQFNIGIFRIEASDEKQGIFEFSVHEDLDCSGTSVTNETKCQFDEGLITGILESFYGKEVDVVEDECWGTGAKACRFRATVRQ